MVLKRIQDEHQLLKRISEGDEHAFTILFYHYLPVLQSFALKFTKSADASEEIIQDAFIRIWLNRDKLEQVENVKAYLYKYISNECLSYLRKSLKNEKILNAVKNNQSERSNETLDSIYTNDINRIVTIAVNTLSEQRRKIYLLSRIEGKNIPEIAEALNLSPNTVKNSLVIALRTIRDYLIQNGIKVNLLLLLSLLKIK